MITDQWLFWTVVDAVLLLLLVGTPFIGNTRIGARITGAADPEKEDQ